MNSADIIADLYKITGDVSTLDLTYGKGVFWRKFVPTALATNDLFEIADTHQDFTATGFDNRVFDMVIIDPPFTANGPTRNRHNGRYRAHRDQVGAPQNIGDVRRLLVGGIKEACRLSDRWVIVKTQSVVESAILHDNVVLALNTIVKAGFNIKKEIEFHSHRRPQPKGRRVTGLGGRPSVFILAERD